MVFAPGLFTGWAHEYLLDYSLDARFAWGTTPFSVHTLGVARDVGILGANVRWLLSVSSSIDLRCNTELGSGVATAVGQSRLG